MFSLKILFKKHKQLNYVIVLTVQSNTAHLSYDKSAFHDSDFVILKHIYDYKKSITQKEKKKTTAIDACLII